MGNMVVGYSIESIIHLMTTMKEVLRIKLIGGDWDILPYNA